MADIEFLLVTVALFFLCGFVGVIVGAAVVLRAGLQLAEDSMKDKHDKVTMEIPFSLGAPVIGEPGPVRADGHAPLFPPEPVSVERGTIEGNSVRKEAKSGCAPCGAIREKVSKLWPNYRRGHTKPEKVSSGS